MSKLRSVLPKIAKRTVWNLKYGVLGYPLARAPSETVKYFSTRLSSSSSLLDLGCGDGSLLRGLRDAGWNGHYCGVDISRAAIGVAKQFSDQNSTWAVSDIESFRCGAKWDAVAMIESLYYVKLRNVPSLLLRVINVLNEHRFALIRIHDVEKHRNYVGAMERRFPLVVRVSRTLFRLDAGAFL
jgi:cyclopropane fatty-acyl-phospholipid synthase-like methyltransferase